MLLVFSVMVVWGANFVVSKVGLAEFPPVLMMAIRFSLTAAVMLPFVPLPPRRSWPHYAVLSLTIGSLHYALMFSGLKLMDASMAAILIQLQVPFAALLAALLLNDRLGWRRGLGMGIAFAGVVLILGEPKLAGDPIAVALVLTAGFIWAIANVQIKWAAARGHEMDPFALSAWVAVLAAPQLWLLTGALETGQAASLRDATWVGWGAILYMVFGVQVLSYSLWYAMVRRYDVNQTMPWTLLAPVIGVITGVTLLDEPMSAKIAIGAMVTLAGVAIIVIRRPKLADPAVADASREAS